MNRKLTPFVEYFAESTTACLVTMAQGNLLGLTLTHLLVASQTGLFAGIAATVVLLASRAHQRWIIAATLGVATAVVDFVVHPGMFGPVALEAIVTGIGAAILSYLVGALVRLLRAKKATQVL
jgi:hypothetical protein